MIDKGSVADSAIKAMLDFVQPHFIGRDINMYEDDKGTMTLAEKSQGSFSLQR